MKLLIPISLIVLLATPALAQGVRDSDTVMNAEETIAALSGNSVEFFDGSTARYSENGSYTYRYDDSGPLFTGTYAATDGGEVCVTFSNGFDRCDTYVQAQDRLVLIIEDGTRFPVRAILPIPE